MKGRRAIACLSFFHFHVGNYMHDKRISTISIDKFSCSKVGSRRHLVAEASELRDNGFKIGSPCPPYLIIEGKSSPRMFGPIKPQFDNEGDVYAFIYEQKDYDLSPVCEVHILND